MTCRNALLVARAHAVLVEQISVCAPPVTAPYLQAAYDRMKLPIKVRFAPFNDGPRQWHFIVQRRDDGSYGRGFGVDHANEATRGYLALCASLTQPTPISTEPALPTSRAQTAGASAPALSSPSASVISPMPQADVAAIPLAAQAGDSSPGSPANLSSAVT